MHPLYSLLSDLDAAGIHYQMFRGGPKQVMISALTPGLKLEIDVFEDGRIEFSKFEGDETPIDDLRELRRLINAIKAKNAE
jgi:hypothetical protein